MKVSLSVFVGLILFGIIYSFIYPPNVNKDYISDKWFDQGKLSIFVKKNGDYSLWRNNKTKPKFIGGGKWKISKEYMILDGVKNPFHRIQGKYRLIHAFSSAYRRDFFISDHTGLIFSMRENY